ncbi:MAG: ATP-binding protein [Elusimicrobiota bacterium]
MRIKLLYKFIIVLVLIGVIPLSLVGLKTIDINKDVIKEQVGHSHTSTARFLSQEIDSFIESIREKLLFIINSQSMRSLDYKGKQALIQSLLSSTDYFITISLVNPGGEEFIKTYHPDYSQEAEIKDLKATELFKKASKGPAVSEVYTVKAEPRMDVLYPIEENYIFITLTLSKLWHRVRDTDIGKEANVFLIDSNGRILAHPVEEMEGKTYDIPPVQAALSRSTIGSMEYNIKEEKMVGAYAPVKSMGWGIVTQQPYKYAYSSVIKMRNNAYRWIIFAGIAAVLVAFFMARGLSNPILKIIQSARKISKGDFSTTVNVKSRDEIKELATTFNNMVSSLKRYKEMQIDKIVAERTKTKAIIFSIQDGIVLTDEKGNIMLLNKRARELLEIKREPEEGENIFNFIKDKNLKTLFKEVKDAEIELERDNKRKVIKAITEDVKTNKGRKLGRMRIIRDITLEKEVDEMKERFMHSVTHDLKNPLSAIIGTADLLQRLRGGKIKESEQKYFQVLRAEANRLMGMINDILNLAKLEANKMELNREEFDITKMLKETKDAFSAQAQANGINIIANAQEERLNMVGDKKLIKRVIVNLVGNSIKYTPRGGEISLRAEKKDNNVQVSVKDTGEGMPGEVCEKIFDRFQQVEGREKGGTGIGLNVSKEIVEAHEGKIWAESELGKGSEFKFSIPLT